MLGRHHISITLGTLFPFVIPLLFIENANHIAAFAFLVAGFVGSLTPDADCGGNATLHYKFRIVDWLMKNTIIKLVVFVFSRFVTKKYSLEYKVKEEHRGIMHAPIGILISSFMLSILPIAAIIYAKMFDVWLALGIFFGLLIGQFLHLLEDSCTVSGINWKFPFGTKELKGQIYTFQKEEGRKDFRPLLYQMMLGSVSLILFFSYGLNKMTWPLWQLYPTLLIIIIVIWLIMITLSKSKSHMWYIKAATYNKINKSIRIGRRSRQSKKEKKDVLGMSLLGPKRKTSAKYKLPKYKPLKYKPLKYKPKKYKPLKYKAPKPPKLF